MIEQLEWDSKFFDKKIGKIELVKHTEALDMHELEGFDLVYIFATEQLNIDAPLLDVKVTYSKVVGSGNELFQVTAFNPQVHSFTELLKLVYLSGHDSRFRKDPFFGENKFQALYKTWIEKSIQDPNIKVLVYVENLKILGFVTLVVSEHKNSIDLIAVDPIVQGKGIGKALIGAVESNLLVGSILNVTTQESNLGACATYEKSGFKLTTKQFIYHYAKNTIQ
jgi:ribosomal protein S18 acetylase RimI-like enzyme